MDNNQNNNFSGSSYNNNQYNYNNDNQNTSGTWSSSGNAQNSWSACRSQYEWREHGRRDE